MELKQKLYDDKNTRKTLLDEAKALVLEGKQDSDDYKAKMASVAALNGRIEATEALIQEEEKAFQPGNDPAQGGVRVLATAMQYTDPDGGVAVNSLKAFASAARSGFPVTKDLSEGSNEDGGYTVPEDIITRVETLRDAKASLRQLVGVESVTTSKGRRTFKKRTQQIGFSKVAEGGKIPKAASPQFSILNYEIGKYAGFLPVTSELLEDSDENITSVLVEWIADEARVTDNKLILAAIKKKAAVALNGLDGIKKALMVDLGSAFLATSKIVTNDEGLFWLASLKDKNGRDLLNPIPSDPGKMQLAVGANVVPVVVIPKADLPSNGTKVPFILGDLVEGIRLFDRKAITMTSSDVAVAGDFNAFEQDMTLTKALLREDVQQRDAEAYIYGEVDTTSVAPTSLNAEGGAPVFGGYTEADLTAKTNAELWAIASELGAEGVTASSTKAELVAAILAV